ncbi:MAG TPA: response regulator [Candidatus Omnitrophota bacterium]|nr:response regulator [Candidatus Omnitrophota bacterium]
MEKKRILVIDDDEHIANLIKLRLESAGEYEVKTLFEATDIIGQVRAFKPDVILLDLLMPDIGGLEACRRLNDDAVTYAIPIIVISALSKDIDKLKAYKLGIIDYIVKPFDPKILIATIEKAIRAKRGAEG